MRTKLICSLTQASLCSRVKYATSYLWIRYCILHIIMSMFLDLLQVAVFKNLTTKLNDIYLIIYDSTIFFIKMLRSRSNISLQSRLPKAYSPLKYHWYELGGLEIALQDSVTSVCSSTVVYFCGDIPTDISVGGSVKYMIEYAEQSVAQSLWT